MDNPLEVIKKIPQDIADKVEQMETAVEVKLKIFFLGFLADILLLGVKALREKADSLQAPTVEPPVAPTA